MVKIDQRGDMLKFYVARLDRFLPDPKRELFVISRQGDVVLLSVRTSNLDAQVTVTELVALRRKHLLHARSLAPGSERNQARQIALSLRALLKNKKWLEIHALDE